MLWIISCSPNVQPGLKLITHFPPFTISTVPETIRYNFSGVAAPSTRMSVPPLKLSRCSALMMESNSASACIVEKSGFCRRASRARASSSTVFGTTRVGITMATTVPRSPAGRALTPARRSCPGAVTTLVHVDERESVVDELPCCCCCCWDLRWLRLRPEGFIGDRKEPSRRELPCPTPPDRRDRLMLECRFVSVGDANVGSAPARTFSMSAATAMSLSSGRECTSDTMCARIGFDVAVGRFERSFAARRTCAFVCIRSRQSRSSCVKERRGCCDAIGTVPGCSVWPLVLVLLALFAGDGGWRFITRGSRVAGGSADGRRATTPPLGCGVAHSTSFAFNTSQTKLRMFSGRSFSRDAMMPRMREPRPCLRTYAASSLPYSGICTQKKS
eukprot:PhM_4_TR8472/c0_g1_i1/m.104148